MNNNIENSSASHALPQSSPFSVLIRVDANPSIGSSDLVRMMSLAHACRQSEAEVTFVSGNVPHTISRRIEELGCKFVRHNFSAGGNEDAELTSNHAAAADWTVVDGQHFDASFHKSIRQHASRLLVTDYGSNDADLILYQTGVKQSTQTASGEVANKVIGGLEHVLTSPELSASNDQSRSLRKNVRFQPKRILVAIGVADIDNWTLTTIRSLEKFNLATTKDFGIDVIIGNDYAYEQQLAAFCREARINVRIHRNVDRIDTLVQHADLAIVGGHKICFELARVGVPMIAIATEESQNSLVDLLQEQGVLVGFNVAGDISSSGVPGDTTLPMNIHTAIEKLIRNRPHRQSMSERGRELLDGLAADRITRRMHAGVITLRDVREDDSQQLLAITQQRHARGESFQDVPSATEHQTWLKQTTTSEEHRVWIAEDRTATPLATVEVKLGNADQQAHLEIALTDDAHARKPRSGDY